MPKKELKTIIEEQRLGLRLVDEGGKVDSGSCYYLFPVGDDWDSRLRRTCKIYKSASRPEKKLHLLGGLTEVVSGEFDGSFAYGRVTGRPESLASVSMYGNESEDSIEKWVLAKITERVPKVRAMPSVEAPTLDEPSAFASCCSTIAHVFTCCLPGYARLDDDLDIDLR